MSIDKKFIVNLKGNDFVTYEGLLNEAHEKGLIGISTELIELPSKDNNNRCIMKAIAKTDKGQFEGYGDADTTNVNSMIAKHLIRMAETRAKARALRDLTNIGMTALEELGGEDETPKISHNGISEGQIKRLYAIGHSKGIDNKTIKSQVKKKFNKEVKDLTRKEYDKVCKGYSELDNKK